MGLPVAAGLVLGWLADRALGDPQRFHPVAGFGRTAGRLESLLYADDPGRGAVFTAVAVGVPCVVTWRVQRHLGPTGLTLLTAVVTWSAVGGRQLDEVAGRIADHLGAGGEDGLAAARSLMPWLVGRDPASLDAQDVIRAVVESVAENTSDAVVGPLVWGALLGPVGVVAFRTVNTLDAMVGHRSPRYGRFGTPAARADDVAGVLPSRLTALLTVALAGRVDGSPGGALAAWVRDARRHPSPNAGPVEAAAAGALEVGLGGLTDYGDRVEVRGPLGTGPPPSVDDIGRMRRLATAVGAGAALVCAAVASSR